MTKEEAIALSKTEFWKHLSDREIAEFQLFEEKLCMPFGIFKEALSKSLGRPVFTHELGLDVPGLQMELMGERTPPSLTDILELIPEEKRIIARCPDKSVED